MILRARACLPSKLVARDSLFSDGDGRDAGSVQHSRDEASTGRIGVLVLGESAAMGDPGSAYGFSRYLEVTAMGEIPVTEVREVRVP